MVQDFKARNTVRSHSICTWTVKVEALLMPFRNTEKWNFQNPRIVAGRILRSSETQT
jgi:hypothetical protein